MELIASCAFGLEKLVYDEIKALGLWVVKKEDGRVIFEGEERDIVRTNLWLRCADRVQIKIGEFTAETFDELFDKIKLLEWEKYIGPDDTFPVDATSTKSALHSEPAIQSIVKKAIVRRLEQKHDVQLLPENSGSIYQILVKANKDQFIVTIDTSGESLHKRGYRSQANIAPIKETLAAALVKLSDWTPDRTLIDPFCGSGTILIEAALIAQNIAPGLDRAFVFQTWRSLDAKMIEEIYEEARQAEKSNLELKIQGSDLDQRSLETAKQNAKKAGISNLIFKYSDFNDLEFSTFENCTFIANPPYGERLEETATVEKMYQDFGKKFKESKNCSLFLITSNENFPRLFGRPADKNRKLFNGNIRCYLYSYFAK